MRRTSLWMPWLACLLLGLSGCASARPAPAPDRSIPVLPDVADDADEGRSLLTSLLLYVPNRVLDLTDIVRVGVDVGPGFGGSAQVTTAARAAYLNRLSVGVGLQTLRHLPVKAAADVELGVGPLGGDVSPGLGWYRSPADIRVEVHPLLVGAHVAVEPLEITDLVLGLFGFDISEDDF